MNVQVLLDHEVLKQLILLFSEFFIEYFHFFMLLEEFDFCLLLHQYFNYFTFFSQQAYPTFINFLSFSMCILQHFSMISYRSVGFSSIIDLISFCFLSIFSGFTFFKHFNLNMHILSIHLNYSLRLKTLHLSQKVTFTF